jgi:glycosyltransferase involved in cell wall biosynthesis
MTKKIKKIAIITTHQNYKWISMQEVLPSIEKCWEQTAFEIKAESRIFNVDIEPLRNFINYLFQCDAIIIIAFNETIARFMKEVRSTLNLPIPFVLHLYGHASLGLWPQNRFNVLPIMTSGDAFIGTCPGDMKCMKLTGDNFLTFDIPYPYFSIEIDSSKLLDNKIKFAYIGRISDQKNIDVLVEAYYLLSLEHDNLPPFLIYGKEDHFGSPNMGIPSTECLKYLKDQIEKLNLTKKIIFKGFQSREVLYGELGRKHIFLSASTHSDENFGMALLRSLSMGATALVSHWGGHIPFQEKCPHKIWTVPVEFKNSRPRPDPIDFKNQMQIALEHSRILFDKTGMDSIPDYFLPDQIIKEFAAVLEKLSSNAEPLNISQTAREMYQQQLQYENAGDMQRVFASYDDHKAQLYLNAYRE